MFSAVMILVSRFSSATLNLAAATAVANRAIDVAAGNGRPQVYRLLLATKAILGRQNGEDQRSSRTERLVLGFHARKRNSSVIIALFDGSPLPERP